MSFNPAVVPDRDSLPLKKRDQRPSSPAQQQQEQQRDSANFKVPYPYKSINVCKSKHTGPFQPVPRRVPALYQPWTHTSSRSKAQVLSAFREHHGWAEWRDFNALHPGWDFSQPFQHQTDLSPAVALHPSHLHHPSRFSSVSLVTEGFHRVSGGYSWERTLRDRNKGPYVRRGDRKTELFHATEKESPPSKCLPHSPHEDLTLQHEPLHKSTEADKYSASGPSFIRVSSDDSKASVKEELLGSPSSPNRFPWLLPHFVAGSLIELRDGQLRRVEHLQTEDFLLGSLACPDLRLSCCTVQSISSSSSSSSSISRLLFLLHEQQSQELVDVYVEYPFFVRGRGWSSCSPQRTARLCGLQCRQLSVGDVCLALTPVSAPPTPPPSATLGPNASPRESEGGGEPPAALCSHIAPGPKRQTGRRKMGLEALRRRHYSAPELRGPGTNCM